MSLSTTKVTSLLSQRLQNVFDQFCINPDDQGGHLSRSEAMCALTFLFPEASSCELLDSISSLDTNKDGKISLEEFSSLSAEFDDSSSPVQTVKCLPSKKEDVRKSSSSKPTLISLSEPLKTSIHEDDDDDDEEKVSFVQFNNSTHSTSSMVSPRTRNSSLIQTQKSPALRGVPSSSSPVTIVNNNRHRQQQQQQRQEQPTAPTSPILQTHHRQYYQVNNNNNHNDSITSSGSGGVPLSLLSNPSTSRASSLVLSSVNSKINNNNHNISSSINTPISVSGRTTQPHHHSHNPFLNDGFMTMPVALSPATNQRQHQHQQQRSSDTPHPPTDSFIFNNLSDGVTRNNGKDQFLSQVAAVFKSLAHTSSSTALNLKFSLHMTSSPLVSDLLKRSSLKAPKLILEGAGLSQIKTLAVLLYKNDDDENNTFSDDEKMTNNHVTKIIDSMSFEEAVGVVDDADESQYDVVSLELAPVFQRPINDSRSVSSTLSPFQEIALNEKIGSQTLSCLSKLELAALIGNLSVIKKFLLSMSSSASSLSSSAAILSSLLKFACLGNSAHVVEFILSKMFSEENHKTKKNSSVLEDALFICSAFLNVDAGLVILSQHNQKQSSSLLNVNKSFFCACFHFRLLSKNVLQYSSSESSSSSWKNLREFITELRKRCSYSGLNSFTEIPAASVVLPKTSSSSIRRERSGERHQQQQQSSSIPLMGNLSFGVPFTNSFSNQSILSSGTTAAVALHQQPNQQQQQSTSTNDDHGQTSPPINDESSSNNISRVGTMMMGDAHKKSSIRFHHHHHPQYQSRETSLVSTSSPSRSASSFSSPLFLAVSSFSDDVGSQLLKILLTSNGGHEIDLSVFLPRSTNASKSEERSLASSSCSSSDDDANFENERSRTTTMNKGATGLTCVAVAIQSQNPQCLKTILDNTPEDNMRRFLLETPTSRRNPISTTPIFLAVEQEGEGTSCSMRDRQDMREEEEEESLSFQCCRILCENLSSCNNRQEKNNGKRSLLNLQDLNDGGVSPLLIAVLSGNLKLIKLLLSHGADPKLPLVQSSSSSNTTTRTIIDVAKSQAQKRASVLCVREEDDDDHHNSVDNFEGFDYNSNTVTNRAVDDDVVCSNNIVDQDKIVKLLMSHAA